MLFTNLFNQNNYGIINQAFSLYGMYSGAQMQQQGFRNAISGSETETRFNQYVNSVNTNRDLDNLARKFQRIASEQKVQAAATGFSTGSKSFLALMSENMAGLEKEAAQIRSDSDLTKASIEYRGNVQKAAIQTQMDYANYQSNTAIIRGVGSILGSLF